MSAILGKIVERASGSDLQMEQTISVMQQVKSERFAWQLLRELYEDRIDRQPQDMLDDVKIQPVSEYLTISFSALGLIFHFIISLIALVSFRMIMHKVISISLSCRNLPQTIARYTLYY